jgi:hypothetical protein
MAASDGAAERGDMGRNIYSRMEIQKAAEVGAQAVWKT